MSLRLKDDKALRRLLGGQAPRHAATAPKADRSPAPPAAPRHRLVCAVCGRGDGALHWLTARTGYAHWACAQAEIEAQIADRLAACDPTL